MLIHRGNYVMWKIIENRGAFSLCQCTCGKQSVKQTTEIYNRPGCACSDCRGKLRFKFQKEDNRFLNMLDNMKARCYRVNHPSYSNYGGRGITICEEWLSDTKNFVEWAKSQPDNNLTIKRKKNDLGYSPDNCYFASRTEQNRNRRNAKWVEYNGERLLVSEAARASGIGVFTLRQRIKKYPDSPELWFKQDQLPRGKYSISNPQC